MGENAVPLSRKRSRIFQVFLPNGDVTNRQENLILLFWIITGLGLWFTVKIPFIPQPQDVAQSFPNLWLNQGLAVQAMASIELNLKALALSTAISLGLCYMFPVALARPLISGVSKGRFLGLSGLFIFFILSFKSQSAVKLAMLTFGETVFFVTSMQDVVKSIRKEKFDHARTQGMSEWRVVYEVVVLGTVDQVFDIIRSNAAIGWTMLTMVEGISRSDAGLGGMLLNGNKHLKLEEMLAIQLVIVGIGIIQDLAIQWAKRNFCPYSQLSLERR